MTKNEILKAIEELKEQVEQLVLEKTRVTFEANDYVRNTFLNIVQMAHNTESGGTLISVDVANDEDNDHFIQYFPKVGDWMQHYGGKGRLLLLAIDETEPRYLVLDFNATGSSDSTEWYETGCIIPMLNVGPAKFNVPDQED